MRKTSRMGTAKPLDMSAMIDVVFLLLIFLIVLAVPVDRLAQLDASRPRAERAAIVVPLLQIDVRPGCYVVNGKTLDERGLAEGLLRFARHSTRSTVKIVCDAAAPHGRLVAALDACAAARLESIALFSR